MLANAADQSTTMHLSRRFRQQAGSYEDLRISADTPYQICIYPQKCITPTKSATIRALHSDRKDFAP